MPEDRDAAFDCLACGACCRDAFDGRILVGAADLLRWKRTSRLDIVDQLVAGHFGQDAFPANADGACAHLGNAESANHCNIYETRGESCHALKPGDSQCRSYRRAAGVD